MLLIVLPNEILCVNSKATQSHLLLYHLSTPLIELECMLQLADVSEPPFLSFNLRRSHPLRSSPINERGVCFCNNCR
ncbi:hypothetical protein A4A49_30179 [Nicotiana attenuata]|uniref:Uncharacterized protein n=1 Tax=Nicotiana attenuata TaxID=49451 RepID=A0A1J6HWR7_NICAT|nr:hypothetical protein A4A49_30179 [Nicotiana attenuata]